MTDQCVHEPCDVAKTFGINPDPERPFAMGFVGTVTKGLSEIRVCKKCACMYIFWSIGHTVEENPPVKDAAHSMRSAQ